MEVIEEFLDLPFEDIANIMENLDKELVLVILQYLNIQDIQNFCNSTSRHRRICKSNEFNMMLQAKIDELRPVMLDMGYQDILKFCRDHPILQNFCENDDEFWDAKFRIDFAGELRYYLEEEPDAYIIPTDKTIKDMFDKESYEEYLEWDNINLLDYGEIKQLEARLKSGMYLKKDLPLYIEIAENSVHTQDARRLVEYIVYDLGVPVSNKILSRLERSYSPDSHSAEDYEDDDDEDYDEDEDYEDYDDEDDEDYDEDYEDEDDEDYDEDEDDEETSSSSEEEEEDDDEEDYVDYEDDDYSYSPLFGGYGASPLQTGLFTGGGALLGGTVAGAPGAVAGGALGGLASDKPLPAVLGGAAGGGLGYTVGGPLGAGLGAGLGGGLASSF